MKTIIKNNLISAGISILLIIVRIFAMLFLFYDMENKLVIYISVTLFYIFEFIIQFILSRVFLEAKSLNFLTKCCSSIMIIPVYAFNISALNVSPTMIGFGLLNNILSPLFLYKIKINLNVVYIIFCYLAITLGLLSKKENT